MTSRPHDHYVLGHSRGELRRLAVQAAIIDPITTRFLTAGGLAPGHRVLDVGCGGGHVSFLAAAMVGPTGSVVGVDRSQGAVDAAAEEAQTRGLGWLSFRHGDPTQLVDERPFDAVVGRYVLQFQPDPTAFLRALVHHLPPGGHVIFHELDWDGPRSFPVSPLHDLACSWAEQAIRRSGARTSMGRELRSTFVDAGLPEPFLHMEGALGGGEHSALQLEQLSLLVETLLPSIVAATIATADEVGVDTLLDRLRAESESLSSVIFGRLQMGCWSTLPGMAGNVPAR